MEMILENLPMALCVLLGMGLILVEVFLPGFGLPGISGIALVGVGTIMAAMHFGTLTAVALLLVIIAVLAVLVSWLLAFGGEGRRGQIQAVSAPEGRTARAAGYAGARRA